MVFFLILVLPSCQSTNVMSTFDQLTANKWTLANIPGMPDWEELYPKELPFLDFDDGGRIDGTTGCNNFHGNYSVTDNGIDIDPGAITRKMCPGNGETTFMKALQEAKYFNIQDNRLILSSESGPVLELIH